MESSHKLLSIAISGIPKEFTKPEIENIFKEFGNVVDCHIDCPSTLPQLGEKTRATVKYASKIEAATAIARLDRQPPLHLRVDWIGLEMDGKGDKRMSGVSIRGTTKFNNVSLREQSLELQTTEQVGHQLYVPPAITDPCANCSRDGKLRCSRCKTWYCSVACQEDNWTRHRQNCYAPPPLENPDGSIYDPRHDTSLVTVASHDTSLVAVASHDTSLMTVSSHNTASLVTVVNHDTTITETGTTAEKLNSTLKEDSPDKAVIEIDNNSSQPTEQVSNVCDKPMKTSRIEIDNKVGTCESSNVLDTALKYSKISVSVEKDTNCNKDTPAILAERKAHGQVKPEVLESHSDSSLLVCHKGDISPPIYSESKGNKDEGLLQKFLLDVAKPTLVTVTHAVSPYQFYVVPESSNELFESIVMDIQEVQPDSVPVIKPGQICLAKHDELWYRSQIIKVSSDGKKANLVFIDFGNHEEIDVTEIKSLEIYKDVTGMAVRVKMAGLGPAKENWTTKEIVTFKEIVDEGGETKFSATLTGFDKKGEALVNLVDEDKKDVASLCVDVGVGIKIKKEEIVRPSCAEVGDESDVANNKIKDGHEKTGVTEKIESAKREIVKKSVNNTLGDLKIVTEKDVSTEEKSRAILKFNSPTEVSVIGCVSPRQMVVLPSSKADQWNEIVTSTQDPAPATVHPNIGQLYLAKHDDLWCRALLQKLSPDKTKVKVDLVDFGVVGLKLNVGDLRELKIFKEVEPLAVSVGLAGLGVKGINWGENEIEMFKQIVDFEGETQFIVESSGVSGGVEMVTMKDTEGNDVKEMCVELEIGIKVDETFNSVEKSSPKKEKQFENSLKVIDSKSQKVGISPQDKSNGDTKIEKEDQKSVTPEVGKSETSEREKIVEHSKIHDKKIQQSVPYFNQDKERKCSRSSLPTDQVEQVAVCFAESPTKFYVTPTSKSSLFTEILLGCQEIMPGGKVSLNIGSVCLVLFEDFWYRAEVEKVSPDRTKAKVFLLDYGKTVKAAVSELKPLNQFMDVPWLVCDFGLNGVKPAGTQWSQEEVDNFTLMVDAGGETKFMIKALGVDGEGVVRVQMKDEEDNDVAQLCLSVGVGVACDVALSKPQLGNISEKKPEETEKREADDVKSPELRETKEKKIVPKSTRSKPASPIKPAPPLKNPIPVQTSAAVPDALLQNPIPVQSAPFKNPISLQNGAGVPKSTKQVSGSTEKLAPSPASLPGCSKSILISLIPGSKLQLMKDTESPLTNFSSICMVDDDEAMNYLLDDFQTAAAQSRVAGLVSTPPSLRSWVVGWSPEHQMYYRAVVVAVTAPDSYTALLIDFGMTQTFRKQDLFEMWPEAASRKAMAIQLTAMDALSPEAEKTGNAYFVTNPTVDGHVVEKNKEDVTLSIPAIGVRFRALPWFHCDAAAKTLFQDQALADTDAPSGEQDLQTNGLVEGASEFSSQVMMKDLKTSALVDGANVKYCGHGDKLCDVYVKQEIDEEKVASLMTTLNLAMCSRDSRDYREPMIGSIVAVKWSEDKDKMTYRASVTAINLEKKKAKLLLIDYGNRIVEDWTNITWLPNEVRKSPMYCVPVVLADVPTSPSRQHTQIIDNVAREFGNNWVRLACVANVSPPTVKLLAGNKTLNSALIVGDEDISEKEKKRLEIARKIALLEQEMSKI